MGGGAGPSGDASVGPAGSPWGSVVWALMSDLPPPPTDLRRGLTFAHAPIAVSPAGRPLPERAEREERDNGALAPGATRAVGAGHRAVVEEPDRFRTCFERDLDRIHHAKAFRRLAGKCQVFVEPEDDHLRTRLTHAIEVCQVAVSIARPTGLNVALTAAAATGHDCGHGPAGHASEGALSPFVEGGYHHAVYGADVVLAPLNLCTETLDAIRNHSWNRPAPATPEGEVVAWADRIAYVCHDFEDAIDAGLVTTAELPPEVTEVVGADRRSQLHGFITAMVDTIGATGVVGLRAPEAAALAAFRAFNYERIYLRPAAVEQADRAARLISSLAEYYLTHPSLLPDSTHLVSGSPEATAAAVRYVSGMTDRFAQRAALDLLGWDEQSLPRSA
ncbi:MAG: dGTP triphosphohydrolase [Acidimicrobiales bacterium]|nr:dGTP triphosphohydrolase [Acidimicrobiales bacterium]